MRAYCKGITSTALAELDEQGPWRRVWNPGRNSHQNWRVFGDVVRMQAENRDFEVRGLKLAAAQVAEGTMFRRRLATLRINARFTLCILVGVRVMTEMRCMRLAGLAKLGARCERKLQRDHQKQKQDE